MLFSFAINADPCHLPTLVKLNDDGPVVRVILIGMKTSGYFDFIGVMHDPAEGEECIAAEHGQLLGDDPSRF